MSNSKISQLTQAFPTTIQDGDSFPIARSGTTRRLLGSDIINTINIQVSSVLPNYTRRYATDIGNGSLTAFTVTHNLNTRDVITQVYRNSDYRLINPTIANTTVNTVSLTSSAIPASNAYRVVVIG